MININVSRPQTYKMEAFQIVGDARATLEGILPMIEGYRTAYGEKITELKNEWVKERERLKQLILNGKILIRKSKPLYTGYFK